MIKPQTNIRKAEGLVYLLTLIQGDVQQQPKKNNNREDCEGNKEEEEGCRGNFNNTSVKHSNLPTFYKTETSCT